MDVTVTLLDRMSKENRDIGQSFNKESYPFVFEFAMKALTTKTSWLDLTYHEGDAISSIFGKPGQTFSNVYKIFDY